MNAMPGRVPLEVEQQAPAPPADVSVPPPADIPGEPAGPVDIGELKDKIVAVLRTCFDPEIPVNIHELGLIYDMDVSTTGAVTLRMTLTSPACPVAGSLPPEVQAKVRAVPGVTAAKVDLVWDPPWTPERMSDAAKLQLGMF